MKGSYTPRQGQYLTFIHHYTKVNGRPPAQADMQRYFRVSPPTVHQKILDLERHGWIARVPGEPRSLRVLLSPERLPELESPFPPPRAQGQGTADAGGRTRGRENRKWAANAAKKIPALDQLTDGEAAIALRALLETRPDWRRKSRRWPVPSRGCAR